MAGIPDWPTEPAASHPASAGRAIPLREPPRSRTARTAAPFALGAESHRATLAMAHFARAFAMGANVYSMGAWADKMTNDIWLAP